MRAPAGSGLALLVFAAAAVRNLRPGPVDFDEDEIRSFELGESLARHVYAGDLEQILLHLVGTYRPPLPVIGDAAALLLMRPDPHALSVVRVAWVLLLLAAVAGIAGHVVRRAGCDAAVTRRARLLAMILVGTAPATVVLAGSLMSEVPLTALTSWALLLLLRLEERPTDRVAAGLGAVVGAGLLVKWTLPVSLAAPAVAAVLWSAHRAGAARRLGVAAAVAAAIAGPWYLLAGPRVAAFVFEVGQRAGSQAFGSAERGPVAEVLHTSAALIGDLWFPPVALLVAVGAATAARRRLPGTALLLAALVGPVLLFSLLATREARHLLPAMAAASALGGAGLAALGAGSAGARTARWLRPAPITALALAGLVVVLVGGGGDVFPYRRAVPADLPVAEIDTLAQDANPGGRRRAAVMSPEPWLWTPLWARGVRANAWTRWRAAWCAPHIVDEAAFFLVADPPGGEQRCATEGKASLEKLGEIRGELRSMGSWTAAGKRLELLVHPGRLYGARP